MLGRRRDPIGAFLGFTLCVACFGLVVAVWVAIIVGMVEALRLL